MASGFFVIRGFIFPQLPQPAFSAPTQCEPSHTAPQILTWNMYFAYRIKLTYMLAVDNEEWVRSETVGNSVLSIDNYQLTVIPRGEIDIKGKGKMKT